MLEQPVGENRRLRRALDEYQVGGIKTTLRFFREIVKDQEFIEARLDTGFISRFNERRELARSVSSAEKDGIETQQEDIALIAAALHYIKFQKLSSLNHQPRDIANRWKMSGRVALVDALATQKRSPKLRGS